MPFASRSKVSTIAESLTEQIRLWRPETLTSANNNYGEKPSWTLPMSIVNSGNTGGSNTTEAVIPASFKSISNIDFDIYLG